jgi:hypothetical protein
MLVEASNVVASPAACAETISQKCGEPIAVGAIAQFDLGPNFRGLGHSRSRGSENRQGALPRDHFHEPTPRHHSIDSPRVWKLA